MKWTMFYDKKREMTYANEGLVYGVVTGSIATIAHSVFIWAGEERGGASDLSFIWLPLAIALGFIIGYNIKKPAMKAIILVAGYATRMYPLTENQPKALLPLKGKPVLDYIMEQIYRLPTVDHIYVVSNTKFYPHFSEWAQSWRGGGAGLARASAEVKDDYPKGYTPIPVTVLDDGTTTNDTRRGAIGDIQFTIDTQGLRDELFIVAGDNYFTYDLLEQYEFYKETGCDTLAGKELDDREALKAFAVAKLDEHGKVLDLVEKPPEPESNIAIYASYFYRRDTVPMFKQYLDEGNNPDPPGAFPQWLHKKRDVYAYTMNGDCYDIGTIETYNEMNAR